MNFSIKTNQKSKKIQKRFVSAAAKSAGVQEKTTVLENGLRVSSVELNGMWALDIAKHSKNQLTKSFFLFRSHFFNCFGIPRRKPLPTSQQARTYPPYP